MGSLLPVRTNSASLSLCPPSIQVLRADLKELWTLDLKGKPYAYTPFCTSREETLGFQFWRGGFWKDHLRGRPYHISALYVVDLQVRP